MCKPRYIYHSISSISGIARQEQAQVQELQATHAQRAITTASLQIVPKSCIYCVLFALMLDYLPFKIRNKAAGTRTTAITHTACTLADTSCCIRKCAFTNISQKSFVCFRINLNHDNPPYLYWIYDFY